MLRFVCPRCRTPLQVPESAAGRLVACSRCQQQVHLQPAGPAPSAPAPPRSVPPAPAAPARNAPRRAVTPKQPPAAGPRPAAKPKRPAPPVAPLAPAEPPPRPRGPWLLLGAAAGVVGIGTVGGMVLLALLLRPGSTSQPVAADTQPQAVAEVQRPAEPAAPRPEPPASPPPRTEPPDADPAPADPTPPTKKEPPAEDPVLPDPVPPPETPAPSQKPDPPREAPRRSDSPPPATTPPRELHPDANPAPPAAGEGKQETPPKVTLPGPKAPPSPNDARPRMLFPGGQEPPASSSAGKGTSARPQGEPAQPPTVPQPGGPAVRPPDPGTSAGKVVQFCKDHLGQQVGNGQCTALAEAALQAAGDRPWFAFGESPGRGDYVWGNLVYVLEIKGGAPDERKVAATGVLPGDVVQLRDVKFEGRRGAGRYVSFAPHHTAVVADVQENGRVLVVLEQNSAGRMFVVEGAYRLDDLKAGWLRVYRPVPK